MKTIKQIADELGVSKQRVYRCIKRHRISEAHQENGVMWYDDTAESLIRQDFMRGKPLHEAHHEAHHEAVIDTVISMFQRELDVKNQQIADLNERLAESNAALVAAQRTAEVAQALHAGTIKSNHQLTGFTLERTDYEPLDEGESEAVLSQPATPISVAEEPTKKGFLAHILEYFAKI